MAGVRLCSGIRETLRALHEGRTVRVYIAQDAGGDPRHPGQGEALTWPVEEAARAAGVEIVPIPTMKALGVRCGLKVRCAAAAELRPEPRESSIS